MNWYENPDNFPCWVQNMAHKGKAYFVTHSDLDCLKAGLYNNRTWVFDLRDLKNAKLLVTEAELRKYFPERLL